jgi:hypothetical protein
MNRAALVRCWRTSVFLNHHFGRLYHRGDLVAFFEFHLLGAVLGNDRFDHVVSPTLTVMSAVTVPSATSVTSPFK